MARGGWGEWALVSNRWPESLGIELGGRRIESGGARSALGVDHLMDKEQFLGSLCVKAGMNAGEWKKADLVVETYQAEVFGE